MNTASVNAAYCIQDSLKVLDSIVPFQQCRHNFCNYIYLQTVVLYAAKCLQNLIKMSNQKLIIKKKSLHSKIQKYIYFKNQSKEKTKKPPCIPWWYLTNPFTATTQSQFEFYSKLTFFLFLIRSSKLVTIKSRIQKKINLFI